MPDSRKCKRFFSWAEIVAYVRNDPEVDHHPEIPKDVSITYVPTIGFTLRWEEEVVPKEKEYRALLLGEVLPFLDDKVEIMGIESKGGQEHLVLSSKIRRRLLDV
jgi:hypothetical protein